MVMMMTAYSSQTRIREGLRSSLAQLFVAVESDSSSCAGSLQHFGQGGVWAEDDGEAVCRRWCF